MTWETWTALRNDLCSRYVMVTRGHLYPLSEMIWSSQPSLPACLAACLCCFSWFSSTCLKQTTSGYDLHNQVSLFFQRVWQMEPSEPSEDPPLCGSVRNHIGVNTWCSTRPSNLAPRCLPGCSVTGLDWLLPKLERKCANLQPDPGEGRSQEQAFGPFTSRIHHQRWTQAHLG